jgi:hypothetical protein
MSSVHAHFTAGEYGGLMPKARISPSATETTIQMNHYAPTEM